MVTGGKQSRGQAFIPLQVDTSYIPMPYSAVPPVSIKATAISQKWGGYVNNYLFGHKGALVGNWHS